MWPYKMRWLWNGAFLCPCTCHYLLVLFRILETFAELHVLGLVYLLLSRELWCTWNTTFYSHVPTISCTNCVIPQTVQSHTPILLWTVMHLTLSFHPLCTCDCHISIVAPLPILILDPGIDNDTYPLDASLMVHATIFSALQLRSLSLGDVWYYEVRMCGYLMR
jgi:hypothetical protein